ncbi:MAG: hypothetical protein JRJ29_12975 [Deltaproteobacteria bacterium]|nr:hypothetical protein [Deltaproteobacteria bacterium]
MPTYRLEDQEVVGLTAYLKSLKWEPEDLPESREETSLQGPKMSVDPGTDSIKSGKGLLIEYNSIGCHEIKGMEKGEKGPAWDGIGSRPLMP